MENTHSQAVVCPALRIAKPGFYPDALCSVTGEMLRLLHDGSAEKGAKCPLDGATNPGLCVIPPSNGITVVPFVEIMIDSLGRVVVVKIS